MQRFSIFTSGLILITYCVVSLGGCDKQTTQEDEQIPKPPTLPPDSSVVFRYATVDERGEAFYELPQEQASLLIQLLNSTPTVSHDAADWYMEAADPICSFEIGERWYQYHGWLLYEDSEGNAFIWVHSFISEVLWYPPPTPATVAERFEKMKDYNWLEPTK